MCLVSTIFLCPDTVTYKHIYDTTDIALAQLEKETVFRVLGKRPQI